MASFVLPSLGSAFLHIRVCPGLSFATKRIGPSCCTLFTFITCYSLPITLSQNYLLPLISVPAENTLLETAYHFLLLLVGFDTLTYRKDYNRSPILVGHQQAHPHPRGQVVAPLAFIFCKDFLLFLKRCSVKFQVIPRTFFSAHK